jgi:hypothetical protein
MFFRGLVVIVSVAAASCTSTMHRLESESEVPAQRELVGSVNYVIEHIHPSFWRSEVESRLFIDFFVYPIAGRGDDILWVDVTDPYGGRWHLDPELCWNRDRGYIGGFYRWQSGYKPEGMVLALGVYIVEVYDRWDRSERRVLRVNAPSSEESHYRFIVSHVDLSEYTSSFCEALEMASVPSVVAESGLLKIQFTVTDDRVKDGEIVFLDDDKNYVGDYSLTYSGKLNDGRGIFTDGRVNTVQIGADDISLDRGESIGNIHILYVRLQDGLWRRYSHLSRSELVQVPPADYWRIGGSAGFEKEE